MGSKQVTATRASRLRHSRNHQISSDVDNLVILWGHHHGISTRSVESHKAGLRREASHREAARRRSRGEHKAFHASKACRCHTDNIEDGAGLDSLANGDGRRGSLLGKCSVAARLRLLALLHDDGGESHDDTHEGTQDDHENTGEYHEAFRRLLALLVKLRGTRKLQRRNGAVTVNIERLERRLDLLGQRLDGDGALLVGLLHFRVHGEDLREFVHLEPAVLLVVNLAKDRLQGLGERADADVRRRCGQRIRQLARVDDAVTVGVVLLELLPQFRRAVGDLHSVQHLAHFSHSLRRHVVLFWVRLQG